MPLRRFETQEAARQALWTTRDDPRLVPRIRTLWDRARRLIPGDLGIPRGVRRYRSIEEANEDREAWTRERVRAIRAARSRGRPASGDAAPGA